MLKLRVNGLVAESIVDGPGLRFAIFTQGCHHNCLGCHNPSTHDVLGGYEVSIDELFVRISKNPLLAGVTFSGGEPFLQPEALSVLAKMVHSIGKTVVTYTGYTVEHLNKMAKSNMSIKILLDEIDILIDGPYIEGLRDLNLLFRGSTNQRVLSKDALKKMCNIS